MRERRGIGISCFCFILFVYFGVQTQPSEVSEVADFLIELSEPIPSLRELYLGRYTSSLSSLLALRLPFLFLTPFSNLLL